jgi:hypothetical protein
MFWKNYAEHAAYDTTTGCSNTYNERLQILNRYTLNLWYGNR